MAGSHAAGLGDAVGQDVRYALRLLRRTPMFTAVVVASMALGIGANTAIFTLIDSVMLRALPVRAPGQLVELRSLYPGDPPANTFHDKYYERFRDRNRVFTDLVGVAPSPLQWTSDGGETTTLLGEFVSGNLFPALGLQPAIGRLIAPADDRPESAVAVLSWSFWTRRFQRDPTVIGTQLVLDGTHVTVVGVGPQAFSGLEVGRSPDLWLCASLKAVIWPPSRPPANGPWGGNWQLLGRLKPGVSIESARADLEVLDRVRVEEIAAASGNAQWRKARIDVVPAAAGFGRLRDQYGGPLVALIAGVGVLLLIACVNVAGLLMARGAARRQEMAVRTALGASRGRIVRLVLTESVLLSAAGGILAPPIAYVAAAALVRLINSSRDVVLSGRPIEVPIHLDARVLLFTAGIALATGVLFGLAPAWSAFASPPMSSIRELPIGGDSRPRRRLGMGLVLAQVALSLLLLSGAVVFAAYLSTLRNAGVGFDRSSVLLITLSPQGSGLAPAQLSIRYQELLARLQAIPGVQSASLSAVTPIEGPGAAQFIEAEGFTEAPEDRRYVSLNRIGPRFFETFGTPIVEGREFAVDDQARPPVAIVNQAMVRRYFAGQSAVGRHLTVRGDAARYEIVGVVGDAKYMTLHRPPPPMVYLNAFQQGRIASKFALRASVAPASIAGAAQRIMREVVPTVGVARVTTLEEQVNASIVPERLIATLSGAFGALGALLAALGVYGLLAYTVARRTSEIGIRMALGATAADVTKMVLAGALWLIGGGLALGAPGALAARRVAAAFVQDMPAFNAAGPVAAAAAAIAIVALVAAYIPARRAARIRPMDALRHS
jgi:putative ABC transport system permease protein